MSEATNPKTNRVRLTTTLQGFFTWLPGFFTWPVTVLCFILIFWSPLQKLIQALPDALANSETLTIGSLSLRVGKSLSDRANQDVREGLSGMTSDDITFVVMHEIEGPYTYINMSPDFVRLKRLERLGMLKMMTDDELAEVAKRTNQPKSTFGFNPTSRYDRVRKFLLDVLTDVVTGGLRDSQPVRSGS